MQARPALAVGGDGALVLPHCTTREVPLQPGDGAPRVVKFSALTSGTWTAPKARLPQVLGNLKADSLKICPFQRPHKAQERLHFPLAPAPLKPVSSWAFNIEFSFLKDFLFGSH